MNDFQFNSRLIKHKFAKQSLNQISYRDEINTGIIISSNSTRIPVICINNGSYMRYVRRSNNLVVCNYENFNGMKLTKEKMVELLNISYFPIKVFYLNHVYYVGKAFLARVEPDGIKYLLIGTVPRKSDQNYSTKEVTMWVNSEVHSKKENRPEQVVINLFLSSFDGDIIITSDVVKYVGNKFNIPEFETIDEYEDFTKEFLFDVVESFRKDFNVESLVL